VTALLLCQLAFASHDMLSMLSMHKLGGVTLGPGGGMSTR
jgi:hypothetical protein